MPSSGPGSRRMTIRGRTGRGGYRCAECGHQAAQWVGRCPTCQAWGTLEQAAPVAAARPRQRVGRDPLRRSGYRPASSCTIARDPGRLWGERVE